MVNTGPPGNREIELRDDQIIVSRSDLAGRIVYANADFVEVSGYAETELVGQPHNIIRHPDVPSLVFADLWADISAGRPWVGTIKNRCKNGDAYWVEAHISPVWDKGIITGYLSMRKKASKSQIAAAKSIFAAIRENRADGFIFRHGAAIQLGVLTRLRDAFFNAPIAFKLVLSSLIVALLVLSFLAFLLSQNVSALLDKDARERLRHDVGLLRTAVTTRLESSRTEAIDHGRTFSERLYRKLEGGSKIDEASIEALAQKNKANGPNPINQFLPDSRTFATVFVRTPEGGFRRVISNLKNESGDAVLGTLMEKTHPALEALLSGKSYSGSARLFERSYMTNYSPIIDLNNKVIGATFIGINLSETMNFLKSTVRGLKVGQSGYYYLIDVTDGPDFGKLILHPYKEGQRIPTSLDGQGRDIVAEMMRMGQGELVYPWINEEAGETHYRDKLVRFETLTDPRWIVAGGSSLDEFTALTKQILWFLVAGGLAMAAAIFVITLWLLRSLVLQPLVRQVLPAFSAISAGNFGTELNIHGKDEIAQVMQGLECLQNRLAFDNGQAQALATAREAALSEAKALSHTRAQFLANMSHEIRTPMNAVIGLAYLLQKGELGKRERDYVNRIEGAGKLLLAIVNDILDFSKIDAGEMRLEETSFHLDDILENLSSIVHDRVREKNLLLEYVVAPDVPQALRGDPLRLSQILINLVGNAVKFTAQGSVTVFINAKPRAEEGVELQISIKDTGIGMSPEQSAKLFQPFAQADSSVTRKFGGSGLGLVICKRLVALMGGQIRVDSELNAGSIFSFSINLYKDSAEQVSPEALRHHILVVDDNALARTVLARILQKKGCLVETRDSGDAALLALKNSPQPFDFVLLDLNMPNMDGVELAQHIRGTFGQKPKLVLVTASDVNDEADRDTFDNFDGILEKPVTAAKISETLAKLTTEEGMSCKIKAKAAPAHLSLAGMQILVAEDVPTNQLIMRDLLESLGASVEIADNGLLTLECLASKGDQFDLILMDIQMPEMGGIEATKRIRNGLVRPDIPIIALTAHAMDEERQRCSNAGMNDFLTKPIEPLQLIAVLEHWRPKHLDNNAKTLPQKAPLPATSFPELPGIDVEDGLRRMLNRAPLYEKVLRDFYARFEGEAVRILAALAANETEEATRRAHSLKGISGTIGATRLADLARELEQAIKLDSPELDGALERADTELLAVLKGIQQEFSLH